MLIRSHITFTAVCCVLSLIIAGSLGGGALPCVFSFVLNNTPKESIYTVIADTDAIVVKSRWDTFVRRTLEESCVAGISPRPALGAVEWNWLSFKSAVYRDTRKYSPQSISKEAKTSPGPFSTSRI